MSTNKKTESSLPLIGWREWVSLPDLGLRRIKAKIDTGARTSSLHAFSIEAFETDHQTRRVRFMMHPIQKNEHMILQCEADVIDERWVMDSGGHKELRYVIQTTLMINNQTWPIEVTLTNRDIMGLRMLLGRSAMKGRCIINPSRSFLTKNKR